MGSTQVGDDILDARGEFGLGSFHAGEYSIRPVVTASRVAGRARNRGEI
jgi:hypothetical protein